MGVDVDVGVDVGVVVGVGVGVGGGLAEVDIERVDNDIERVVTPSAGEMRDGRDAGQVCTIEERGASSDGCGVVEVAHSNGLAESKPGER